MSQRSSPTCNKSHSIPVAFLHMTDNALSCVIRGNQRSYSPGAAEVGAEMGLDSAWRDTGFDAALQSPREFRRCKRCCHLGDAARALARYAVAAMMAALVCGCAGGADFAPPPPPDAAGSQAAAAPARTATSNVTGAESQSSL